jgi:hypothetical protein
LAVYTAKVTTGKIRSEQIESALPLKAAVERTFTIDSFVPTPAASAAKCPKHFDMQTGPVSRRCV